MDTAIFFKKNVFAIISWLNLTSVKLKLPAFWEDQWRVATLSLEVNLTKPSKQVKSTTNDKGRWQTQLVKSAGNYNNI